MPEAPVLSAGPATAPHAAPAGEAASASAGAETPADLARTEAALLQERRRLAGVAPDMPTVGLALSGGGVRSATFGLGLLRGLAQRGQLPRIDYLSTVSGGGYVGAMFGRLVALVGIRRAQALLQAGDSPVLAWLRRNGRYLTPSGSRDIGFAVVTYLRAFLAIHGEFMAVSLPFSLLVILPHLLHTATTLTLPGIGAVSAAAWQPWQTLWWPIAVLLWLGTAPGLMSGYWVARDGADPGQVRLPIPWRDLAVVGLLCLGLAAIWVVARPALPAVDAPLTASALALVALSSSAIGLLWAHARLLATGETRSLAVARLRNRLTAALRAVTLAALVGLGLGALDLLSWWLLLALQSGEAWVYGGIGVGGAVVLALRTFAQPLLALSQRTQSGAASTLGPKLLNAAGLFGFVVLMAAWVVGVQWLVFTPAPLGGFDQFTAATRAGLLLGLSIVWLLLTMGNAQMPNASSLHTFYRARLTRAYLAVGNPERKLAEAPAAAAAQGRDDVTHVVPGDDTGLRNYRPERAGGPIHLINVCLNQTRDDASGLYNADRKGTLVTATARGFELGVQGWWPMREGLDAGTLGRWVAVSGAAAAPGAGAYTSRGWALLLYFLGVRLGYWVRSPLPALAPPLAGLRRWLWRHAIKPVMLWSEGTATYFGAARPWWYLSDGGHFDNTGVYALLKRRLDFIIAADCGADAEYDFADIENLVRKARIDLGAEIEFYTREEAARLFTLTGSELTVLSPESMGDVHSARGVLLARVRYRAETGVGGAAGAGGAANGPAVHEATLLVIKPNLHDALDVDLLAYAQRHLAFPHQSTGDQSFDEAQWESYHRLGEDFGRALHEPWLRQLPGWGRHERHPLTVAARLRSGAVKAVPDEAPWWRRTPRAAAIGASIGVGVTGTLLLSLWQLQEQLDVNRNNARTEVRRLFTEVSSGLETLDRSCPKLADHTATQLLLLHDLRESPVLLPIEQDGIKSVLGRLREACDQPAQASADCVAAAERLSNGVCVTLAKRNVGDRVLDYWAPLPAGLGLREWWAVWRTEPGERQASARASVAAAAAAAEAAGARDGEPDAAGMHGGASATAEAPIAGVPEPADPAAARAAPAPAATTAAPTPAAASPTNTPSTPNAGATNAAIVRDGAPADPAIARACAAQPALRTDAAPARPLQIYTQVYDEASRQLARGLRRQLQQAAGEGVQVAPVEDVTRSASLRGTRRPVPWPHPTFVLHTAAERACAEALRPLIRKAWTVPGRKPVEVWIRQLPGGEVAAPGRVLELWLPRREDASRNVEFW
jgi:predicted acylesterase/phospholipase RssA